MRVRVAVLGVVAGVLLGALTSAPAHAVTAPTMNALDASTPGHLTGTVTTDGPFVRLSIGGHYVTTFAAPAGGTFPFDLPTWGLGETTIRAATCETADTTDYYCPSTGDVSFTATDVRPTITWSADDAIGPGESVAITANDAGGGLLRAFWVNDRGPYSYTTLSKNGTTQVAPSNGVGTLFVQRCSAEPGLAAICSDFDPAISKNLRVRRVVNAIADLPLYASTYAQPVSAVVFNSDVPAGTFQVSWQLRAGFVTVKSGSASGTVGENGTIPVPVDGSGVSDGNYELAAAVVVEDPEFGTLNGTTGGTEFRVRRTGPPVTKATVDNKKIWPFIDTRLHPGFATVTMTSTMPVTQRRIEVFDQAGKAVGSMNTEQVNEYTLRGRWNGEKFDVGRVAPGTYTARMVDEYSSPSSVGVAISVSREKLVPKTYTATVSASGSLIGKYVGRCSRLRKPSLRKWKGSLGFYSNTKCKKQTWKSSAASTSHAIRLPAAAEYKDIKVSLYGGAAKSAKRSQSLLRYGNTKNQWSHEEFNSPFLGTHHGETKPAADLIWPDRYFFWGLATAYKSRYDVKTFTVTLRYYVLGS